MSKVVRSVKNVTKGYSHVQVKVRNATSNDPWGPTGTEMSEISQLTFNGYAVSGFAARHPNVSSSNDFYEIMDMLDKRMNDKGKNWRHVLKSLKVLDYCLHEGSELVVTWARKNVYIIKTLREFQYVDDDGKDVGQNVSAKELTSLILDEERLRTERSDRKTWKSRVTGIDEFGPQGFGGGETSTPPRRKTERRKQGTDEEDAEYRLALEASKYEAEEDKKRRAQNVTPAQDDDLAKAIKLSKEEEELRRRELEESNAASLFDDTPAPSNQQPQYTGFNQGYQQQGAVDWFGNPVDQQAQQQQPQSTGYLNNAYTQPTGFQPQQTGFQNGFQPQQTGFDQSQFQQQQPNYLQPQQTIQPQQTAFDSNPYGQQQNGFGNNLQQQQQVNQPTAGSHNPWATNQQSNYDALKPMPTGSNNPFATTRPQIQQQQTSPPSLSSLAEQKATTNFNNQSSYNPIANYQAPQQTATQQKPLNPQHERLNALLASGEGMDTFGNTGDLRIPSQHTAPGTFVNSSGQGLNKLHAAHTGNNPFFSQQFSGVPQQQQQEGYGMAPAQTGPAGVNGFGSSPFGQPNNNPFGGQQQRPNQPQSGSLIDL
ncbi:epsin, partial [Lecanoromycetidae sp. Uapishka_2]